MPEVLSPKRASLTFRITFRVVISCFLWGKRVWMPTSQSGKAEIERAVEEVLTELVGGEEKDKALPLEAKPERSFS